VLSRVIKDRFDRVAAEFPGAVIYDQADALNGAEIIAAHLDAGIIVAEIVFFGITQGSLRTDSASDAPLGLEDWRVPYVVMLHVPRSGEADPGLVVQQGADLAFRCMEALAGSEAAYSCGGNAINTLAVGNAATMRDAQTGQPVVAVEFVTHFRHPRLSPEVPA
jgi:hypothetical protein